MRKWKSPLLNAAQRDFEQWREQFDKRVERWEGSKNQSTMPYGRRRSGGSSTRRKTGGSSYGSRSGGSSTRRKTGGYSRTDYSRSNAWTKTYDSNGTPETMVQGWRYEDGRKQVLKAYPRKGDAREVSEGKEMYVCTVRIGHEQPFTVTGFYNTKYRSLEIPDLDLVAKRGYFGPKKTNYRRRY